MSDRSEKPPAVDEMETLWKKKCRELEVCGAICGFPRPVTAWLRAKGHGIRHWVKEMVGCPRLFWKRIDCRGRESEKVKDGWLQVGSRCLLLVIST